MLARVPLNGRQEVRPQDSWAATNRDVGPHAASTEEPLRIIEGDIEGKGHVFEVHHLRKSGLADSTVVLVGVGHQPAMGQPIAGCALPAQGNSQFL